MVVVFLRTTEGFLPWCPLIQGERRARVRELLWKKKAFSDLSKEMNRDQVIATLRVHERELRRRGVLHAALFGSVARNKAKPASDIDILIELEPDAPVGVFEYVGIAQYLADLFPNRVDVANRSSLKALVRPGAERDAVYAF